MLNAHYLSPEQVPIESKIFPELNKKGAYNPVTMVYSQVRKRLFVYAILY